MLLFIVNNLRLLILYIVDSIQQKFANLRIAAVCQKVPRNENKMLCLLTGG